MHWIFSTVHLHSALQLYTCIVQYTATVRMHTSTEHGNCDCTHAYNLHCNCTHAYCIVQKIAVNLSKVQSLYKTVRFAYKTVTTAIQMIIISHLRFDSFLFSVLNGGPQTVLARHAGEIRQLYSYKIIIF